MGMDVWEVVERWWEDGKAMVGRWWVMDGEEVVGRW